MSGMPGKRVSKEQHEERYRQIEAYLLEGLTYREIAPKVGFSHQVVGLYARKEITPGVRKIESPLLCRKCGELKVLPYPTAKWTRCPRCKVESDKKYNAGRNGSPAIERDPDAYAREAMRKAGIWYCPPHIMPESVFWELDKVS